MANKSIVYTIQIKESGKVLIKELDQEVESLTDAYQLLNAELQKNVTQGGRTLSVMNAEISALKKTRDATATTAQEFQKFNDQIRKTEQEIRTLTTTQRSQEQVNADMIANTGLASNTIVEFGRTLSDAPFGIIGVTNNLSNLANNFVILTGKVGGTKNMFDLLIQQLKRGGGLILAMQFALMLTTLFRDQIEALFSSTKKLEGAFTDLDDELTSSKGVFDSYVRVLQSANIELEKQLEIVSILRKDYSSLDEALKDVNLSQEEQVEFARQYLNTQAKLSKVNEEINEDQEDLVKKRLPQIERKQEAINALLETREQNQRELNALLAIDEDERTNEINSSIKYLNYRLSAVEALKQEIIGLGANVELLEKRNGILQEQQDILQRIRDIGDEQSLERDTQELFRDKAPEELAVELFDAGFRRGDMVENLLKRDEPIKIEDIEVAEGLTIADFMQDINDFMKDFQVEDPMQQLDRLQQEAEAQLKIKFDAMEEELGTRIGFEEEMTKIEEFYANKRIQTSNKESEARQRAVANIGRAVQSVGRLLQQIAGEDEKLKIAGVITEKAGAIGSIVANTALANAKAVAAFPVTGGQPFVGINTASAAIGIASTIASAVQAINEIKNPSSATSSSSLPTPTVQAPSFNVVGATQTSQLAQTISQQEQQPIQAFVVESEVTTAQELARKRVMNATLF